ncbi:hypothetical protein C9J03_17070 [Photobacterium gaetbulicola]|nr:hypothetical protein C9J03_17070 [Photobacterium gaetbulicola]
MGKLHLWNKFERKYRTDRNKIPNEIASAEKLDIYQTNDKYISRSDEARKCIIFPDMRFKRINIKPSIAYSPTKPREIP